MEELEYPEHAKNLINREITIFYIEAIPQKISQLRKKYIFFRVQKIFFWKFSDFKKSRKKIKIFQNWNFRFLVNIFRNLENFKKIRGAKS